METTFKNTTITRLQILKALGKFDIQYPDTNLYDAWLQKGNYIFALQFNERRYPPKLILSMASGIPNTDFNGGEETNRVFRQLGFVVENK